MKVYIAGMTKRVSTRAKNRPPIHIPSDVDHTVRLMLRTNPRRSFETITVTDGGGNTVGTVTYSRTEDGIYVVGELHLQKGDNLVKVQCSRPAVLDCWIAEPLLPTTQEH